MILRHEAAQPCILLAGPKDAIMGFRASTKDMRIAARVLAILTIAALLAPAIRWASPQEATEACRCLPGACACSGHHHALGCCNGGQCGVESPDAYLAALLSTLTYVPTEHPWWNPLAFWTWAYSITGLDLLPSHARIPEQPPRVTC